MDEYQERKVTKMERAKITPAIAIKILEMNAANREITWSVVLQYADDMKRGAWREMAAPISFNSIGQLIDGQHRLWAIVESGYSGMFYCATYSGKESAMMMPFDRGKLRTVANLAGVSMRTSAVATSLAIITCSATKIPVDMLKPVFEIISPILDEMDQTAARKLSTAPIKAAIVLRKLSGIDWREQYSFLVRVRLESMHHITQQLYKKLMENGSSTRGTNLVQFGLAWHASSPARRDQVMIKANAVPDALKEARAVFKNLYPELYESLSRTQGWARDFAGRAKKLKEHLMILEDEK